MAVSRCDCGSVGCWHLYGFLAMEDRREAKRVERESCTGNQKMAVGQDVVRLDDYREGAQVVEGWLDGEPIAEENLWIAQEIGEQFVAEGGIRWIA